jgi:hypothetical protein
MQSAEDLVIGAEIIQKTGSRMSIVIWSKARL